MNGKFIVFEGPDGSGKTTILKNIYDRLTLEGYHIKTFREPGGTEISEKIRDIIIDNDNIKMSAKTESLLFAASRAQLVEEKIKPALVDGDIVLSDRFVLSSLTYQGIGRGLGINQIKSINDFAIGGLTPDLTIFFNIDYKTALIRKRENFTADRLESEDFDFHKKIFDGYIDMAERYSDSIKVVDASQTIEKVTDDVYQIIKTKLED